MITEFSFNKERVEKIVGKIEEYEGIWWGRDIYVTEYVKDEEISFRDPFEMIEYVQEYGDEEEVYAIKKFKRNIVRNPRGYKYVQALGRRDIQQFNQYLFEASQDEYWHTHEGRNILSTYASKEGFRNRLPVSSIIAKNILDTYLYEDDTYKRGEDITGETNLDDFEYRESTVKQGLLPPNKNNLTVYDRWRGLGESLPYWVDSSSKEKSLEKMRYTLDQYFMRHSYAHLGFWSKPENVLSLYQYWKESGVSLPIDVIQTKHQQYTELEVDPSFHEHADVPERQSQYARFNRVLNGLLETPILKNKYMELRKTFVKSFEDDKKEKPDSIVEKKKKAFEVLESIAELRKSKDLITRNSSYGFFSNLLFDEELFLMVDILRREELSEDKKKKKLSISYKEILNHAFENPQYTSWEWFRINRGVLQKDIYENAPHLYMDIVKEYVKLYCSDRDMDDKQRGDIRRIISTLFSTDMKKENRRVYGELTKTEDEGSEKKKKNKVFEILAKFTEKKVKEEENIEFFKDTKEWAKYFKSNEFNRYLVTLFNEDEELFNHIIYSLMNNSSITKDSTYFDNVRMVNIVGRELAKQYRQGSRTVEDLINTEKEEIERRIIENANRLCNAPELKVTLNSDMNDPELVRNIFIKYLQQYSNIVDSIDMENINIFEEGEYLRLDPKQNERGLFDALRGLGYEYLVDTEGNILIKIEDRKKFVDKVVGILITPTLFEWAEDDKENTNPNNQKLRSLFFLPKNIQISYKNNPDLDLLDISLSTNQKRYFVQNYLQWYLRAKHTSGDIKSLNSVISTWLIDMNDIKTDVYEQSKQISKETEQVWSDLGKALEVVFDNERFRRMKILEKLLLAVNIEQLIPLVNIDRYQTALLASSILKSALEIAEEENVLKGVMYISSTLRNEFEGTTSLTYLGQEEREKVTRALKALGFSQTDDGLEMFRDMWTNFWYLRGFRGESQTLKITSAGIEISNPKRNMYEYEERKKETDKSRRKFGGGQDKVLISWSQIRDVKEIKIDLIPINDLAVRLITTFASVSKQKTRPKILSKIESKGPANIKLKLPGRDEPLCEIFALHKPQEFWKLLQDFSKLMVDEEASEDALELLKVLRKN